MIKPICRNLQILSQKARPAGKQDIPLAKDLLETLAAHSADCVGMAANMIGAPVNIIAVSLGPVSVAMLNPRLIAKKTPYQTKEGCLSLVGQRPATRYQQIVVEYQDLNWQPQSLSLTGFAAEAVQHEIDHCNGIII
ncbi:peptide deformylase [Limosilactobacillus mucosae]|uniref:Peptide deformylase n=1 Tax=Limosilactobacillus mucosae TaxID=97478 RepID=A0AAJ1HT57_LIMMU|nr:MULTISPECIES: peptide deformylase [Lactobacillaceae]MDD6454702.1 peptide deformylase [Lactobacillus sp.]MDC2830269.1 peptide deformylase [Limosilactobacillus mucosae]MDC2837841.1 peptide deformylase [Limosilactobacillus mucosae]MDC2845059.1 peptide deformylase [Limosilactobacillus mucosae]MDC2849856.1 peptide deformylase [Limosilactobacillus mucosae]